MEKEKLKEWLSTLAGAVNTLVENRYFSDDIVTTNIDEKKLHIYGGLRKIANTLGLELHEEPWECDGAIATYICFEYEGVKFFELENYTVGEA